MEEDSMQKKEALKMPSVTTLLSLALCIVLGLMLLCNLVIIIKGTLFPERPPSVLGITPMVVLSGSMSGEQPGHIEVGDLIFVSRADPASLKVGDVIAFMSGQTTVTHRIVSIETQADGSLSFITKGDANAAQDTQPVSQNDLVGLYRFRIPKAGDLALFLQQPLGMLLFAGIPLLAFILYDVLRRQRFAARERQKAQEMEAELARLRQLAGESQPETGPSDGEAQP